MPAGYEGTGRANYNGKSFYVNLKAKDKAGATSIMNTLFDTEIQIDKVSSTVPKTNPSSSKVDYINAKFTGYDTAGKTVNFAVKLAANKTSGDVETALKGTTFNGVKIETLRFNLMQFVDVS